jgi:hypothetical protein
MKKVLLSEVNRINELMGLSLLNEATGNPLLTIIKRLGAGFEREILAVTGEELSNLSAKGVSKLLGSKSTALKPLIISIYQELIPGMTKAMFNAKTFDELVDELALQGVSTNNIKSLMKRAGEDWGEPRGGFPANPKLGTSKTKPKPVDGPKPPKPQELTPTSMDLATLMAEGASAEQAVVSWFSKRLKTLNLPKIPADQVDDFLTEVVAQVKAKIPQISRLEVDSKRILQEFQTLPREQQREILIKVQKEMYRGGIWSDFANSFKLFDNPNLKLYGYKEIMKKTLGLNIALTISTIISDVIRAIYDFKEDINWRGHFGLNWFPALLAKLSVNFVPYFNVAANFLLFLESIIQGFIDYGLRSGKKDETDGLDNLMQQGGSGNK